MNAMINLFLCHGNTNNQYYSLCLSDIISSVCSSLVLRKQFLWLRTIPTIPDLTAPTIPDLTIPSIPVLTIPFPLTPFDVVVPWSYPLFKTSFRPEEAESTSLKNITSVFICEDTCPCILYRVSLRLGGLTSQFGGSSGILGVEGIPV